MHIISPKVVEDMLISTTPPTKAMCPRSAGLGRTIGMGQAAANPVANRRARYACLSRDLAVVQAGPMQFQNRRNCRLRLHGGVVRRGGVDPPRPFGHESLKLACLPVPSPPQTPSI